MDIVSKYTALLGQQKLKESFCRHHIRIIEKL